MTLEISREKLLIAARDYVQALDGEILSGSDSVRLRGALFNQALARYIHNKLQEDPNAEV